MTTLKYLKLNKSHNMKAIYKYVGDFGRQGMLEGVFVAEVEIMDGLVESDVEVYYGEALGKHSEIYGSIDYSELTQVTTDSKMVELFELYDLSSGVNPLNYSTSDDVPVRDAIENFLNEKKTS